MPEQKEKADTIGIVQTYGAIYGPYAFGVASLLIIWFSIVKPELNHRSLDFEQQNVILRSLAERDQSQIQVLRSMESQSETMKATANVLERVVDKLDKK